MHEAQRQRATEAFWGRRRGKPLTSEQSHHLDRLLPGLRLDIDKPAPADVASLFSRPVASLRMEIGFGGGEHLPETGFIGVEPFVNGMAKLVKQMAVEPRDNVRLYDDDATRVLDWLPDASIDHLDLLYPDPWPKMRHWKRRFVSDVNLDRIARVLKPGGRFCFASDIDSYVNWTLLHCARHPSFDWQAESRQDWMKPYDGWPGTRYEAKALREERTPAYLTFLRA
jgi:tRNA (guanine-N7-)-methyltransferase